MRIKSFFSHLIHSNPAQCLGIFQVRKLCFAPNPAPNVSFPPDLGPIANQLLHIFRAVVASLLYVLPFDMDVYLKGFLSGAPEGLFLIT